MSDEETAEFLCRDIDEVRSKITELKACLDGYMRRFAGLPDDKELYVPLYIFDSSNAKTAGVPAGYDTGYGDQHVDGYAKLWKLK